MAADDTIAGGRIPASITCVTPFPGTVLFDFNPSEIRVNRKSELKNEQSLSTTGGGLTTYLLRGPVSTITIGGIRFEGMMTKSKCDQLLNWLVPGSGPLGRLAGAVVSAVSGGALASVWETMPVLTFTWGPPMTGFVYSVVLNSVDVTYERFTQYGIPIRAKVSVVMTEQPSLLGSVPTNPTSGGLPGRREHLVSQGENLQSIAMRYFGSPGAWRPIAAINRIEDPMRLRPGQRVFIPNPDELVGGGV